MSYELSLIIIFVSLVTSVLIFTINDLIPKIYTTIVHRLQEHSISSSLELRSI